MSTWEAVRIWPAYSEAILDRVVRAQTRRFVEDIFDFVASDTGFSGKIHVGRPESHLVVHRPRDKLGSCEWHKTRGRAHAQLHPWPVSSFVPDAWFDGTDIWITGALAAEVGEHVGNLAFIIAHEIAHAENWRTEADCDLFAMKYVEGEGVSVDYNWIKAIRDRARDPHTDWAMRPGSGPPFARVQ